MKTLNEIKKRLENHKAELMAKYHIKNIGFFGSIVRGESTAKSDLDKLPDPDILALEIIENVEAGLASFKEVVEGLNRNGK